MNLHVLLFARARDLAGCEKVAVELPAGATVADLRRRVVALYPKLADLAGKCAVAVEAEFVGDDRVLREGAEIALLPPVSGG
jgi:molybdopterin converting factor subunit 1